MVTPRCCCWYLAKATEKNGASNVEPAPARVGLWLPGLLLAAAATDAEVPGDAGLAVLVHAVAASRMIAATGAQEAGCRGRRGRRLGLVGCPDMTAPLR